MKNAIGIGFVSLRAWLRNEVCFLAVSGPKCREQLVLSAGLGGDFFWGILASDQDGFGRQVKRILGGILKPTGGRFGRIRGAMRGEFGRRGGVVDGSSGVFFLLSKMKKGLKWTAAYILLAPGPAYAGRATCTWLQTLTM